MNMQNRAAPPIPKARKNNEVNVAFEDKAKDIVRDAMRAKGVSVDQLTARLALIGVEMSSGGVANKISRGGFSSAFLLQCLAAMDLEIRVE
ncbi:DUF6471 domain-containing protein [Celeribacter baekdonensis]|uniref:DUF6471 domain-containing protein n=1 Tax=Celeribacter baekdonensis TaxID=875171 RepID=UPI0030DB5ED3|tara:strand:- start:782 stop:1054 length:273 start_codon:yes stop_codon:yes gene_type:complete